MFGKRKWGLSGLYFVAKKTEENERRKGKIEHVKDT